MTRFDLAEEVENASIEQLRQAREATIGLAGAGALLMMHALLMPDTPSTRCTRLSTSHYSTQSLQGRRYFVKPGTTSTVPSVSRRPGSPLCAS
jgi:hypothetical protein